LREILGLLESSQGALGLGPDDTIYGAVIVTEALEFELGAHRDK
jgi:hypothetical protein